MSDYEHNKALRYKPTEQDIELIGKEIEEWRINNRESAEKYSWIREKSDWPDYLECIKFPELIGYKKKFECSFGDTERYIDLMLYHDYGIENSEWYKVRYTTKTEQDRFRKDFKEIFPGLDMDRTRVVDYCYYNCCEPNDLWEVKTESDEFYKEMEVI